MNMDFNPATLLKCDHSSLEAKDIPTESGTAFLAGTKSEDGIGGDTKKDAANSYRRAAEAKLPQAQVNLGWMYANGMGVPHDLIRAYMWFYISFEHQAPEQKRPEGKANCKTIEENNLLDPDGIAKAKSMAEKCRDNNYKDC